MLQVICAHSAKHAKQCKHTKMSHIPAEAYFLKTHYHHTCS